MSFSRVKYSLLSVRKWVSTISASATRHPAPGIRQPAPGASQFLALRQKLERKKDSGYGKYQLVLDGSCLNRIWRLFCHWLLPHCVAFLSFTLCQNRPWPGCDRINADSTCLGIPIEQHIPVSVTWNHTYHMYVFSFQYLFILGVAVYSST